jgi:cysteine-rich repeat protein
MRALPLAPCLAALFAAALPAQAIDRVHRSSFEDFACQDGVAEESEQCDDGDADDLDGCTSLCRIGVACDSTAFPGGYRFAVDPASGHCYVAHENESTTFEAASSACLAQVGHLASLTSAAEELLVRPLQQPGQLPWIGATDLAAEGTFAWLSGEPFSHQNFIPGQPDGDGNCLHLGNAAGGWNDADCDFVGLANARLCERAP